ARVSVHVHAVRDDDGVGVEMFNDRPPGVLGDGDPRADPFESRPGEGFGEGEHLRSFLRRVEGSHDRRLGAEQGDEGTGGHERFVDVDDVEVALRELPLSDARDPGAEREPSDRPVVFHRERLPNRGDVLRQRLLGSAGASTAPSWSRPRRRSARSRTWNCTPPGVSKEYGQTIPILMGPHRRPHWRPAQGGSHPDPRRNTSATYANLAGRRVGTRRNGQPTFASYGRHALLPGSPPARR